MQTGMENIDLDIENVDIEMENVHQKLEVHFLLKERIDELINLVDEIQESLEKRISSKRMTKVLILKLLGLGVFLPSFDVGTDIYLAVNLHIAGHHGWAQATLFPCYLNMWFSFLEWLKYEKSMKHTGRAISTLPSVFLQLYPQVRASKVIVYGNCYKEVGVSGTAWISEFEDYEATTAHIEGILEGTSTIFVQTAIFGCMLA